jgi:uncharacterized protein DUF6326
VNQISRGSDAPAARARLSTMWIFVLFNYIYCDLLSVMDPPLLRRDLAGEIGGMHVTGTFFLASAVLMEIPIAMVLLSRILNGRANRRANLAAGAFMAAVQVITLITGPRPAGYYIFFSVIEIGCTSLIAWYAWTRRLSIQRPGSELPARGPGASLPQ